MGDDVPMQCVWDAYKVVMQGILMKMTYEMKKKKEKMIEEIQNQIKYKELEQIKNPTKTYIRTEITILQNKLQNILQDEINKKKIVKQKFFAGKNKAGRLTASLIKKKGE